MSESYHYTIFIGRMIKNHLKMDDNLQNMKAMQYFIKYNSILYFFLQEHMAHSFEDFVGLIC